jgi:hypothetical protein
MQAVSLSTLTMIDISLYLAGISPTHPPSPRGGAALRNREILLPCICTNKIADHSIYVDINFIVSSLDWPQNTMAGMSSRAPRLPQAGLIASY